MTRAMKCDLVPPPRPRGPSPAAEPAAALAALTALAALAVFAMLPRPAAAAEQVRLDAAERTRAGIEVAPVAQRAFGDPLRVVGRVVRSPGATSTVKSILDGRVEAIHVAPGDAVEQGQVVLTLHSHELHRLQGELMRANEALRLADSRVEAGRQLYEIEGISRLELERRQQEALGARLELDSVIAELEDLGYGATAIAELLAVGDPHPTLEVRAPCDGVILELSVARHGWVRSYEPLLTLGNPETLELELQIPPDDAAGVTAGDAVEFVPVGRPQAAGRARVITGVPQVDPTTRTVTVRAALEEALRPRQLLPGVFVEGTLTRGRPSRGAAVPEAAVIRLGARDHVFVHRSAGTFEARPVTLGRYTAGTWEVIDGVTVGEQVAVSGVFLLKSALLRAGEEEG